MISGDIPFMSKHTLNIQMFSVPISNEFEIGTAHMLNGYEICLNTTDYPSFNMYFRYWLCTSILDCFGQVMSPLFYMVLHFRKSHIV